MRDVTRTAAAHHTGGGPRTQETHMIGIAIGVGAIVAVLTFAICVVDRSEQPARDDYDPEIARLGPDLDAGLDWNARWDEEPRPGTGPRREQEADL